VADPRARLGPPSRGPASLRKLLAIMEAGTECGETYERLLWQIGGYFNDVSEREVERRLPEVRHAREAGTAN
jgi:hypothetical protein